MSNDASPACGGINAADKKPYRIITRKKNEYCPLCGIVDPWRKVATKAVNKVINGVYVNKIIYKKCRRFGCGMRNTVIVGD